MIGWRSANTGSSLRASPERFLPALDQSLVNRVQGFFLQPVFPDDGQGIGIGGVSGAVGPKRSRGRIADDIG